MHKYIIRRYNENYYKMFKLLQHFSDHKGPIIRELYTVLGYNTDYVCVNRHDRTITAILAEHCIKLSDDGSLVIRNILEQF